MIFCEALKEEIKNWFLNNNDHNDSNKVHGCLLLKVKSL